MKLSLPPKLVEKLAWVQVILFCKISYPVMHLMPYYAKVTILTHSSLENFISTDFLLFGQFSKKFVAS
jgi:hypothetical protein